MTWKKRFNSPIPKKQSKTWWTNTKQTKIGWKWSKPLLKCSHMYYVHFHKIGSSHFVSLWDSWIRYYEAQTTGSYQWQAGQSKVKPLFIWYLHCVQQTNQIFFFTLKAKITTKYQNESKRIFFLTNNFPIAKLEMENVEKTNSLYNIKDLMKQKSRFIFEILIIFYICLLLFFFDLIKKKSTKQQQPNTNCNL